MTISLRMSDKDAELIRDYAELHNITVSGLFRQAVVEKIELEYDLEAYDRAMKEYRKDPATFSLDETKKELGLK